MEYLALTMTGYLVIAVSFLAWLYTKPGNLQKIVGNELSGFERDIKRCEIIRQILNEK